MDIPIKLCSDAPVSPGQMVARTERDDIAHQCLWLADRTKKEVFVQRFAAQFPCYETGSQQGADFGRENQCLPVVVVIKGLYPQRTARKKTAPLFFIPNCQREHSFEFANAIGAVTLVHLEDDLSVGVGLEDRSLFFEILAKRFKIINLAVKNDMKSPVRRTHWLVPCRAQIQDRETRARQPRACRSCDNDAAIIRSAMIQRRFHGSQPPL